MSNICSKTPLTRTNVCNILGLERGGKKMKKFMEKNCGVIMFYGIIILGVIMLNFRFSYLNNNQNINNTQNQIALNK